MNKNAMTKPSTIKVTNTKTGALHASVGFPHMEEGYVQPLEEQLSSIAKNGFNVEKTEDGIIVTKNV